MDPVLIAFVLRLALAGLLYAFLGIFAWWLWRDVHGASQAASARNRSLGRLIVIITDTAAAQAGAVYPLLPVTLLGRAPTCSVALPDENISLEHALLHLRDGQWWLEDLNSRNGTRLNGATITGAAPVVAGDVVGVGRVELKVELE